MFYFTSLQVDHTHDEKSTAALYEELWKMLEKKGCKLISENNVEQISLGFRSLFKKDTMHDFV